MNFINTESYEKLSELAADIIAGQVRKKPSSVLGLATGSSPLGTYERLAKMSLDFSSVTTVNLDEYIGLSGENGQSYRFFMDKNLFDLINIKKENTYVPNGLAPDPAEEGSRYDELIKRLGGIDLQLLGIGNNGHIGFNEPSDCFTAPTHAVTLDKSTIEANSRFFTSQDDVPTMAITMGMMSIMHAKKILLIANGEKKKEIVKTAFFGKITPYVPASVLQLHPDVTVIYSAF